MERVVALMCVRVAPHEISVTSKEELAAHKDVEMAQSCTYLARSITSCTWLEGEYY